MYLLVSHEMLIRTAFGSGRTARTVHRNAHPFLFWFNIIISWAVIVAMFGGVVVLLFASSAKK